MDLYIFRHGKAGKREGSAMEDRNRTLTPKGTREIRDIARWISAQDFGLDWIATSPLARARDTAAIAAEELGISGRLEVWEALSIDHEPGDILDHLSRKGGDSTGMIVGHEPLLSTSMSFLISGVGSARIMLAKGGIAKIGSIALEPVPAGELEWLLSPKMILRE